MPSILSLKVATFESNRTFARSDLEVGVILRLFVADKMTPMPNGLTQAQQNQYVLDAASGCPCAC